MWNYTVEKEYSDQKNIKYSRILYALVITFVITWMGGVYLYLKDRFDPPHLHDVPVIERGDYAFGEFYTKEYWDSNPPPVKPSDYTILEKYNIGDIVTIRYFFIEGVVMDKSIPTGDNYSVLYRDKNHTLQKIILPRRMLMIRKESASSL